MGTTDTILPPTLEETKNKKKKNVVAARMISSSIGSVITAVSVHPLEVIKVRLQAAASATTNSRHHHHHHPHRVTSRHAAIPCSQGCGTWVMGCRSYYSTAAATATTSTVPWNNEWAETMALARRIVATEGATGLYQGIRPTLVMAVPNTVVYYTLYDGISETMKSRNNNNNNNNATTNNHWTQTLVAGGLARLTASSVTAPLEYLRTVQAAGPSTSNNNNNSVIHGLSKLWRAEGVRSVFKGLEPLLWRDVPFSAIYWVCLEQLRNTQQQQHMNHHNPQDHNHALVLDFLNGALAGTIAACMTTPADVAKTRLQTTTTTTTVQHCSHAGATPWTTNAKPMTTWTTLQQIAQEEGLRGLWKGNLARVLKVAPSCAIMIGTYEFGKRTLLRSDP